MSFIPNPMEDIPFYLNEFYKSIHKYENFFSLQENDIDIQYFEYNSSLENKFLDELKIKEEKDKKNKKFINSKTNESKSFSSNVYSFTGSATSSFSISTPSFISFSPVAPTSFSTHQSTSYSNSTFSFLSSSILTPVPLSHSNKTSSLQTGQSFNLNEFEVEQDPFENLSLKVINDKEELDKVFFASSAFENQESQNSDKKKHLNNKNIFLQIEDCSKETSKKFSGIQPDDGPSKTILHQKNISESKNLSQIDNNLKSEIFLPKNNFSSHESTSGNNNKTSKPQVHIPTNKNQNFTSSQPKFHSDSILPSVRDPLELNLNNNQSNLTNFSSSLSYHYFPNSSLVSTLYSSFSSYYPVTSFNQPQLYPNPHNFYTQANQQPRSTFVQMATTTSSAMTTSAHFHHSSDHFYPQSSIPSFNQSKSSNQMYIDNFKENNNYHYSNQDNREIGYKNMESQLNNVTKEITDFIQYPPLDNFYMKKHLTSSRSTSDLSKIPSNFYKNSPINQKLDGRFTPPPHMMSKNSNSKKVMTKLLELGFNQEDVSWAVKVSKGKEKESCDLLILIKKLKEKGMFRESFKSFLPKNKHLSAEQLESYIKLLDMFKSMGFEQEEIISCLETTKGDQEKTLDLLTQSKS